MHRYTWPITPSEDLHHSLSTKPTPESLNKPTSESPNKLLPGLVSGQQHVVAKQQPEIPHNSQIPTIPARSNCGWNPSHHFYTRWLKLWIRLQRRIRTRFQHKVNHDPMESAPKSDSIRRGPLNNRLAMFVKWVQMDTEIGIGQAPATLRV